MKILDRKRGQTIMIGDSIRLIVCRVKHGEVYIGIDAPRDVRIIRTELGPFDETKAPGSASNPPPSSTDPSNPRPRRKRGAA